MAETTATDLLDDMSWHALGGPQSSFAEVVGQARRYREDVSVFAAIADDSPQAWADLAELVGPGGSCRLFRADPVDPPSGWTHPFGGPGDQMVLTGELPAIAAPPGLRELAEHDIAAMTALVDLTKPGPWCARTFDLGGYLGVIEGGRLVAMAGHRMRVPGFTEISAVCSHPDVRGRGLAAAVTVAVAEGIIAAGDTPMLHVASTNTGARALYERLGFTVRRTVTFNALVAPDPS